MASHLIPILAAVILFSSQSFAQSKSSSKNCHRNFIIGLNAEVVSRDKVGVEKISADLLSEIKKRVPCSFDERNISFTRASEDLRMRRIDMYAFAFSIPEFLEFSDPVLLYSVNRLLVVKKDFYKEGASAEDYLKNPKLRLGAISGGRFFTSDKEIELLQKQDRISFDPFPDGMFKLFEQGKIQAFFISPTYYNLYAQKYSLKEKTRVIADKSTLDLALFLSKTRMSESEKSLFRNAIKSMRTDGSIKKILLKYLPPSEVEKYYQTKN
ncbi:hypothetical protein AZI86_13585 [Bdellovibrio bacteriovorus]|uniref:Solute-binding protein family 3/N-terminal domain-containing protein n=1 Tax=Bdellovibrio bacteriovorus TaxID=959 RepID=A0A150WJU0_BDEBC|nr:transporter substrate-binding domain-containing protein [Bdellovibrio bacteriovorus]KYG63845.1 hypothetical protein AZI86_13585 [Bdellovibrio bacteriovorus]